MMMMIMMMTMMMSEGLELYCWNLFFQF